MLGHAHLKGCFSPLLKTQPFHEIASLMIRRSGEGVEGISAVVRELQMPILLVQLPRMLVSIPCVCVVSNYPLIIRYLCERLHWEQGDFIDDAGLGSSSGFGVDFGLSPGRHIRYNYNNYTMVGGHLSRRGPQSIHDCNPPFFF